MGIISSSYTEGHAQANGQRYVRETHTQEDGTVLPVEYGPIDTAELNLQAIADARAIRLQEQAAEQEFEVIVNGS